jgi:hypothetical protein
MVLDVAHVVQGDVRERDRCVVTDVDRRVAARLGNDADHMGQVTVLRAPQIDERLPGSLVEVL